MDTNRQAFKKLDKSARIQKIVDVSIGLFHKKGYRTTTLDDVSKELGITKAALYHYVSSKENLLSIVYLQALENIFKNMHMFSKTDLPPNDRLRLIIKNHVKEVIIKDLPLFSVFFSEENQLPQDAFQQIQQEKKKYTRIIEDLIKDGIAQGIFAEVDPTLQAYGIIGMCNWVYKWYKADTSAYTPDQIADHFITLLESGYRRKPVAVQNGRQNGIQDQLLEDKPQKKERIYREIKNQCRSLADLIDQVE